MARGAEKDLPGNRCDLAVETETSVGKVTPRGYDASTMSPFPRVLLSALLCAIFVSPLRAGDAPAATRDNLRGVRYGEMVVVRGGPFSFTGEVYNTLGLNDCPEAPWRALDTRALKKEFKAVAVILNGPRYFLMDRTTLAKPGKVAKFGQLEARHLADVKISLPTILRGKAPAYTDNRVKRTSEFLYRKGSRIYELLGPSGERYVMQTYALIVDPRLTEASLQNLGRRLKLPTGWSYRSRVLDEDLVLRATGIARVLQDDFQNSYQRVNPS